MSHASAVRQEGRRESAGVRLMPSERRALGGVLGFLAGMAALGPIAAVAAAVLGAAAAVLADCR